MKRGRKTIPDEDKKKAVIIYLSDKQMNTLGGESATKKIVQNYLLKKIKQNENALTKINFIN
jgi:hypothetical protein